MRRVAAARGRQDSGFAGRVHAIVRWMDGGIDGPERSVTDAAAAEDAAFTALNAAMDAAAAADHGAVAVAIAAAAVSLAAFAGVFILDKRRVPPGS